MPGLHSGNWANNPKPHPKTSKWAKIGQQMTESENGLCKKLSGPNCISNTNYSENVIEIQNTKYISK